MVKDWLQKGPDYYVPIQRKLLLDAADMLKKGGMLLYSTCTFSVKENEENIAYLLQMRPDMELLMPEWDEYFSHGKKKDLRTVSAFSRIWHRAKAILRLCLENAPTAKDRVKNV